MMFMQQLKSAFVELVAPWSDLSDQRFLLSYLGTFCFLFVFVSYVRIARRGKIFRPLALLRFTFKKSVWLHKSALLDYKLYLINMVFMAFMLGFFAVSLQFWADLDERALGFLFEHPAATSATNWGVIALISIALLLAMDFGYWLCHLAMHKSACLWEFHKVHHSALVMTPATEFRQHPVELILFPNVTGFTMGLAYALATHWLGTGTSALAAGGYGMIICVHIFTFHHLRHSHINMPFTGLMGKLLHSPGHHLIHHSDNKVHFDRNMGYVLSVWDWMAGTLHAPQPNERVTLGLGHDGANYDTVANVFWLPFKNNWVLLTRRETVPALAAKTAAG